jgi:threonine dehydrogenase-like Zn-dependent dehydrogenase
MTWSGAAAPVTRRDTVAVVGDGAVGLWAVLASKRLLRSASWLAGAHCRVTAMARGFAGALPL